MKQIAALPEIVVSVDSSPLAPQIARALSGVRVQQRLSLPTQCELVFTNWPDSAGAKSPDPGQAITVSVVGQKDLLFTGEVTAITYVHTPAGGLQLGVRAYDRLHRLRKRQPVRTHVQVTAENLAKELLADLGLGVVNAESGPLRQRVFQCGQSDLELLTEVTARCGLYFTLRERLLHLLTLSGIAGPAIKLELGRSLLEARVEVNAEWACQSVESVGWNVNEVELLRGSASSARSGRSVPAALPQGENDDKRAILDQPVDDRRQAESISQGELDRRVARQVTFEGAAEGMTSLRPGALVDVLGVAAPLAGTYVLTGVNHTIDDERGFISELFTTPPAPAPRATGVIAAIGRVTRVDDPQKRGRVQMSLPTFGDVETDWLGVATAGAGAGKGMIAVPDVGDLVIALFPREELGGGVVIGSLYDAKGPPDSGVEGGAVKRYTLVTPGGQRVRLDDAGKLIRLENAGGSFLEMTPDKVLLHCAAGLEIEAPGKSMRFRANTIDFDQV